MRTYETVRSHVILAWLVLLFPVLIVNPGFISIMFVPLLLLLASGMERILRSWYGIFPHNPYARVAGLIPLVILVGGLVLFGLERYSYGYRYTPEIVQNFSHDALIIPDVPNLVVTTDEQELYEAIAAYKHFSVMTTPPKDGTYAVTAAAYQGKKGVSQIVTVGSQEDAARFYIYK